MEDKKIQRLILKENDVLVISMPANMMRNRNGLKRFYESLRKKLLPRKNKIIVIPNEIQLSVIGEKEVKEYISNIDMWNLWDEQEEENI